MLDTVKINHVQHISFTQSRLTDAVSVILSELLSYEHPSKRREPLLYAIFYTSAEWRSQRPEKKRQRKNAARNTQSINMPYHTPITPRPNISTKR